LRPQPQSPPSVPPTLDPLPRPTQIEDPSPPPDHPGPVTPPRNLEEVPLIHNTPDRSDTPVSNTLERARRDRKPPKYLADYHGGRLGFGVHPVRVKTPSPGCRVALTV